jgi:choline dehydrogenase-like flavoprotein
VVADLAGVGDGLNDHYAGRISLRCKTPITLNDGLRTWWGKAAAGLRYGLTRRGYLTVSAISAGCFVRAHPSSATPDSQCSIALYSGDSIGGELHPFPGVTGVCTLLRPESRGHVRIKSADPRQPPAIDPNYLATEKDRDTVVAGVKVLRRIFQAPAMACHIAEEIEPGRQCQNDDELLDFIRRRGSTTYHPVSTCRMGQDDKAVVDERLRVRGIAGLRVVDASIMPAVVSGNTNAATIMIGEKGADMVLQDAAAGTSTAVV